MSRKFIAAVLAVSTTIAAFTAAPARAASEEDIARILGAAATVFIIGKAIQHSRDKDRDDKKKDRYEDTHWKNQSHGQQQYGYQQHGHQQAIPQVIPRGNPSRHDRAALPAQCVRKISGGHVNRVVMENCLERNYRSARELPRSCKMTVSTDRGKRSAYALPCLRERGYTIARN